MQTGILQLTTWELITRTHKRNRAIVTLNICHAERKFRL